MVYNEDGAIRHAEFRIGDAIVMAFDAKEEWPDIPSFLRLYVEDGDARVPANVRSRILHGPGPIEPETPDSPGRQDKGLYPCDSPKLRDRALSSSCEKRVTRNPICCIY